jgi:succinate dehydrogenase hydrophobic anchor subunit
MQNQLEKQNREGAGLWLLKIVCGILIIALLAAHFIVNHAPSGLLRYEDVVRYYQNPIVPAIEIGFLIFAVVHALLGLRSIILDLNPPVRFSKYINWGLVLLGAFAILYGIWIALKVAAVL